VIPYNGFSSVLTVLIGIVIATAFSGVAASPHPGQKASHSSEAHSGNQPGVRNSISFADITRAAGIDFHLTCGSSDKQFIMETMCGGVAVFDYDNDGWMDIYLVNGSTVEDMHSGKCYPGKLYRNNHDGTFSDVTAKSGLDHHCGWGFGIAVGDYNNDGWEDIYVTYLDVGILYHNNHDGTFTDVTVKTGVGNPGHWGTSAAFGDYDNDGNLDLYVANYVDLDMDHLPQFGNGPFCQYRGIPVSCGPRGLQGGRDRLYHNNGDGTFTEVSEKLNIDSENDYGLGVLWLDYDKDGCLDLYVANDSSPSQLYHNNCHGEFDEAGARAGVAFSADGLAQAGMGVDSADYDNDGWPDIVKINFSDDTNDLYHNDHNGSFTDVAGPAGFGPISIPYLGFGVRFIDFDNDGWRDIVVANGHVNPQVDQHSFGVTYAERPFIFRNLKNGKFDEVGLRTGAALARRYVGRGLASGDFQNRGSECLVMTVLDGSPVLLQSRTTAAGNWILVKTVGTRSNRDGFGARVQIKAGSSTQTAEVRANSSFESASDPRLHFGLGLANHIDEITVRWPSGRVDKIGTEKANQELIIKEGKGVTLRIPARNN
jgi:enediyne biosynthesis protein E4